MGIANDQSALDEVDAVDLYFDCITSCSLGEEGSECVTQCLEVHLKPNID